MKLHYAVPNTSAIERRNGTARPMSASQRQPAPGVVHHSDRGCQYTGRWYQKLVAGHQMMVSMSGAGNAMTALRGRASSPL